MHPDLGFVTETQKQVPRTGRTSLKTLGIGNRFLDDSFTRYSFFVKRLSFLVKMPSEQGSSPEEGTRVPEGVGLSRQYFGAQRSAPGGGNIP